VTSQVKDKIYK
jgi:citrate lyase synthetase